MPINPQTASMADLYAAAGMPIPNAVPNFSTPLSAFNAPTGWQNNAPYWGQPGGSTPFAQGTPNFGGPVSSAGQVPGFGTGNMSFVPTDVLNSMYPYAALGPTLAAQMAGQQLSHQADMAQIAASQANAAQQAKASMAAAAAQAQASMYGAQAGLAGSVFGTQGNAAVAQAQIAADLLRAAGGDQNLANRMAAQFSYDSQIANNAQRAMVAQGMASHGWRDGMAARLTARGGPQAALGSAFGLSGPMQDIVAPTIKFTPYGAAPTINMPSAPSMPSAPNISMPSFGGGGGSSSSFGSSSGSSGGSMGDFFAQYMAAMPNMNVFGTGGAPGAPAPAPAPPAGPIPPWMKIPQGGNPGGPMGGQPVPGQPGAVYEMDQFLPQYGVPGGPPATWGGPGPAPAWMNGGYPLQMARGGRIPSQGALVGEGLYGEGLRAGTAEAILPDAFGGFKVVPLPPMGGQGTRQSPTESQNLPKFGGPQLTPMATGGVIKPAPFGINAPPPLITRGSQPAAPKAFTPTSMYSTGIRPTPTNQMLTPPPAPVDPEGPLSNGGAPAPVETPVPTTTITTADGTTVTSGPPGQESATQTGQDFLNTPIGRLMAFGITPSGSMPSTFDLPEYGLTGLAGPQALANMFQGQLTPQEEDDLMAAWGAGFNVPPEVLRYMIQQATPGARTMQRPAMRYA